MKNPRISVTLNLSDAEVMHILCEKKGLSMSALVKKMVEDWLEDYEDILLAKRAEEIETKWEKAGKPTITHEEMWKRLDT